MRLSRPLPLVPILLAVLLIAPTAAAETSGGAQAPSGEGGAQQATPTKNAQRRPVTKTFRVSPKRLKAGALPRVVVRIDQRTVKYVTLRVALVRVGQRKATATILIEKARTGRVLRPRWPAGTKLREGRYVVRVHAKSPDGTTLRRTAQASGRTTITVAARKKAKAKPKPAPAPTPEPFVLPPSATSVFPVAGTHSYGSDGARFGAGRKGHTHQGQDIIADRGVPVVSPLAGTVTFSKYQKDGAGYYIVIDTTSDQSLFFAHCRKDTVVVAAGQTVGPGQRLCDVGATGDASGPHLHFEIWVGGWRRDKNSHPVDPLAQLQAWDQ